MVRIGIIGTGVGLRTHLPAFRDCDNAEVVAISGSSSERASYFAKEFSIPHAASTYKALCEMEELDLVCVTSPNTFHEQQVIAALQAGKHVLCEKPLAMDMAETKRLVDAARIHGSQLTLINHQLRFNPYLQKVRELVEAHKLGRVYHLRVHQQGSGFAARDARWIWSFDSELGGGVRLAMGSHLIDLVRFWLACEVRSVRAAMDPVVAQRRGTDGRPRDVRASSFVSISLEMEDGADVALSATAAACGRSGFEFSIYGTEGELHFDLARKLRGFFLSDVGNEREIEVDGVTEKERANKASIFSGSFVYFAPRIVTAVSTGDRKVVEPAAKFDDYLMMQKVLDAAREAANSGELIQIGASRAPYEYF